MQSPLVDTHCHLYLPSLKANASRLVDEALNAGVRYIIVPGLDHKTSLEAQELARSYEPVYYAAGVHPAEVGGHHRFDAERFFAAFVGDPKLVGIGEIGLDAYRNRSAVPAQTELLLPQLEFAAGTGLPVILHHRDAGKELVEALGGFRELRGVFHCFDGSRRLVAFAKERGFCIGIAGNVTYDSAHNIHSQLKAIPENLLVLETDAPFMPPQQARGKRECEPADVALTAACIAERLALMENLLRIKASRNSCELFGLPGDTYGA